MKMKKDPNERLSFEEVMEHFNITGPNGETNFPERSYAQAIDLYKMGKIIMELEEKIKGMTRNR